MLNACMKRLSRALVPLASTAKGAYGHDPYGYTPQGTHDPVALRRAATTRKLADGEERWMLETQLVRDRNRIADVLDDCRRLIDDTLAHAGLRSIAVRILYQLTSPMDKTIGPEEVERRQ